MSDLTSLRNSLRRKTHNYETMKAIQPISDETRTNAEKRVTELCETKTINMTTLAKVLQEWSGFADLDTLDNAANTDPSRADTGIRSLKEMLSSRIHTAEVLLATMTTPAQSPA